MKILHVLQSNTFSGAENVVCQIIEMFKNDEKFDMAYCSADGPIRDTLKEKDIIFFPMKKLSVRELKKIIKMYKPDIIHAHDMNASFRVSLCCGKIPFVSHIHNNAFNSRGLSLKSIAYYFAARKAKHIIWVSQSAFDGYFFNNSFIRKSTILYNIIDIDSLYQKKEQDSRIYNYDVVFVGRLTEPKNPYKLLKVFSLLIGKLPDIKLAIVGTGEMEDEIKLEANKEGLMNNLSFLGFQSNPVKILFDSKIMIMTSLWEGTPMCALEAMALGTPIVTTSVDGLKLLVEDGVNGFLADDNEEICDKIVSLLTNEDLLKKMEEKQIEKSRVWNDKKNFKETIEEIYL